MSDAICRCPIGAAEHSPAVQRRVNAIKHFPSPAGKAEDLDVDDTREAEYGAYYKRKKPLLAAAFENRG